MLITGIGDEVLGVIFALVVISVTILAWWSTASRPGRFQTVIVMERTSRNNPHHLTLVGRNINNIRRHLLRNSTSTSIRRQATTRPAIEPVPADWQNEVEGSESMSSASESVVVPREEGVAADSTERPDLSEQAREMDSIVDAMDADTALRNRRLNIITIPEGDTNTSSTSEILETDAETLPNIENTPQSNSEVSEDKNEMPKIAKTNASQTDDCSQKINIKLKYLNDTFREVDGNPDELLKDFKWRHFSSELSRRFRVLLIFNGHVLSDEASTVRECGLYHNCVVHCLIQTPRQPRSTAPRAGAARPLPNTLRPELGLEAPAAAGVQRTTWDMENILMTLVSIILTIIWFFRCEYSNLFTASASGALFALTVFYSIAIFGLYFSDTFNLADRRTRENENQPQPQAAGS